MLEVSKKQSYPLLKSPVCSSPGTRWPGMNARIGCYTSPDHRQRANANIEVPLDGRYLESDVALLN